MTVITKVITNEEGQAVNPEQFLDESGLLFHINRTILHPIGLSLMLAVQESPYGERTTVLHLHVTDNPQGYVLEDEAFARREKIYSDFIEGMKPRIIGRAKALGFIVQGMD